MRVERYEAGTELVCDVTGVVPARPARVRLVVEKFVGGGFAGQVYRVQVAGIDAPEGPLAGLTVGGVYAVKILLPPNPNARRFRDFIYRVGFQGPFSLQVNPAAARAGALWQKFIRRAAAERFADERAVVDVLGTFVDPVLGSCGEISEWVDGRTWRFEVDGRLFERWRWKAHRSGEGLGSPEYRAKKTLMREFVRLLHEMGAPEFARQYEWWTCKSQPNALKRMDTEDDPAGGLTAVDFRAGLALLPFLPMSPGDIRLIFKGLARGSLVQFDRGNLKKLGAFLDARPESFADMREAFDELHTAERTYRDSQIDVTHNHVRLLYSRKLWSGILDSVVTGWRVRNITDDATNESLRNCRLSTVAFCLLGMIPALGFAAGVVALIAGIVMGMWGWTVVAVAAGLAVVVPLLGRTVRKLWGRGDYRRHVRSMLTSLGYLRRALGARVAEKLIGWYRAERIDERKALRLSGSQWRLIYHLPLSLLPAFLHRLLTDGKYALDRLRYVVVRPIRLYFSPSAREQWLREMVTEGQHRHMLTDEDAGQILSHMDDPFIQKYLKSLAVHVCTLPVTQIVSVAISAWFYFAHPEMPEKERAWAVGKILFVFQVAPISPGSLVRGFYVLYLVLRERNFKDYSIAVFLGFFHYVGYLAFPIQMTYRYPALARFMAVHWATGAVNIVPVFGEHGALLEHGVFDLFYNYPLTVRRRMRERTEARANLPARSWHAVPIALIAAAALGAVAVACRNHWPALPRLIDIWPLTLLVPLAIGAAVTIGAGGTLLFERAKLATVSGAAAGVAYGAVYAALSLVPAFGGAVATGELLWAVSTNAIWALFLFALLSTVGALLTELNLPAPRSAPALDDAEQPTPEQQLRGEIGVDGGDKVVEQHAPPGG